MPTKSNDIRTLANAKLQTRSVDTNSPSIGQVEGYACVFSQPSEDMGFTEYLSPTAFDNVDMSNVLALYNHDLSNILGRVTASTLTLNIDKTGLHFILDMPDTTLGRDTYANIQNGNLQGCSFGFTIADDDWSQDNDGALVHTINQINELIEISITPLPAYTETSVAVSRGLKTYKDIQEKQKLKLILSTYEEE